MMDDITILDFFLGGPGDGTGIGPAFEGTEKAKHAAGFLFRGHARDLAIKMGFGIVLRRDGRLVNRMANLNQK